MVDVTAPVTATGSGIGKVFGFGFGSWRAAQITLTLISILVLVAIPTYHSIKEHDTKPVVDGIGKATLGVDKQLGDLTKQMVEHKSVGVYPQLFAALWMYYIFVRGIFWVWSKILHDSQAVSLLVALFTIGCLQVVYVAVANKEFAMPLQGLWYFVKNLEVLIG